MRIGKRRIRADRLQIVVQRLARTVGVLQQHAEVEEHERRLLAVAVEAASAVRVGRAVGAAVNSNAPMSTRAP